MKPVRFLAVLCLACTFCAGEALAQAAAEAVLTHSLSSGAASSMGKTLGNALGNATGQMASRLGQQTSVQAPRARVPVAKTKSAASVIPATVSNSGSSSNGSLIASIQGGSSQGNCADAAKAAAPKRSKADASKPIAPAPDATCAMAAQNLDSHPAVVNLPAAK